MAAIPFLGASLVKLDKYEGYLRSMEQSGWYSNFGPLNTLFEKRVRAEYFGGVGAVTTVNNATSGLMLAFALMKTPGARYAVMPSFTFAATPLAAMWAGLEPYFVDVDIDTFCMRESALERALSDLGNETALVVPYAAFGSAMDLEPYTRLVRERVPVVVDAAASFGATRGGSGFGRGFEGAIVFSLHATKPFGIGEGGVVYSADGGFIERVREAANFGFGPDKISRAQGLNAKLPEISAAVALATLDEFAEKKNVRMALYASYRDALDRRGLLAQAWEMQREAGEVAHQFFPLLCPPSLSNLDIAKHLETSGIGVRTYFCPPCHRQPAFERFPRGELGNTEALSRRALSLPLWEAMTREQVERVADALCATVSQSAS